MRVAFRADGGASIGLGHLMRCLTLADALRAVGVASLFVTRDPHGGAAALIAGRGHPVHCLPPPAGPMPAVAAPPHAAWLGAPWQEDAAATAAALCARCAGPVDWLVVDHYAIHRPWQEALRPHARRIAVIDDLADRDHDADLLLDQNPVHDAASYRPRLPAHCRLLLGTRYALLRPAFAAARPAALARREAGGAVRRLLIAMGGSDPVNATAAALAAVVQSALQPAIDVVLGAGAPHLAAVRAQVAALGPAATLHVGTDAMAELMTAADLALGAPGSASWERCCLGLPALLVTTAANQEGVARVVAERGAALLLGRFPEDGAAAVTAALARELRALAADPARRRALGRAAAALCDGAGTGRVVAALSAG